MRGVQVFGEDFQVTNLTLTVKDEGEPEPEVGPVRLRKDMWSTWAVDVFGAASLHRSLHVASSRRSKLRTGMR